MTQQSLQAKRVVRAGLWASLQNVAREGIGFLVFLVLARLFLDDDDFGIVALANSFVMLARIVGQFGLGTALVRQRDITDRHKTACFWAMMGFATLLSCLLAASASIFAEWSDEPRVAPVLRFLSLGLILSFAGSVHAALLQRGLHFRALAVRALIATACGGCAAIATASLGAGIWSLVVLNLVTSGVSTFLLWRSLPWRPALSLPRQELKELLPTGLRVTGIGIVRYIGDSADRFIVGFFIGIADLGMLYVGQRIVKALQTTLTQSINSVALPAFAEMQDDLPRVRNAYLTALRICLIVTTPLFVGLALVSEQVVDVFLGPNWQDLKILLSVLALAAAISAPLYFNQPLLIAINRSHKALQIASLGTVVQIMCVGVGASFGLIGVGIGLVTRQVIMSGVWLWVLKREIELRRRDIGRVFLVPLIGVSLMSVVLSFFPDFEGVPKSVYLSILVLIGALVYLITLWLIDRKSTLIIMRHIKR